VSVRRALKRAFWLACFGAAAGAGSVVLPPTVQATLQSWRAQAQRPAPTPAEQAAAAQPAPESRTSWTTQPQRVDPAANPPRQPAAGQPAGRTQPGGPAGAAPAPAGPAATSGSATPPEPAGTPAPVIYTRLDVVDAGTFRSAGRTIRFADIEALGLDESCRDRQGRSWPCGRRAQAALQALIRQRSVRCVETGSEGATLVMRCTVARTDISAWLVEQGWARPRGAGADRLAALHEGARNAHAGQFAVDGEPR
jgi:endonuclease YncB( thermonuclease family)